LPAVALRSFSGARVQYVVKLAEGVELIAETPSSGPIRRSIGTPVSLVIDAGSVFAMATRRERPHDRDPARLMLLAPLRWCWRASSCCPCC
jgi:hypothetical protein